MQIRVPLARPDITEAEIEAVVDVLRSNHLSLGPKLVEFEQVFADYIGTQYAVAVNSGTSALYLCLQALGIGPGDEVITTPFTFIASVTTIMMTGATPVFVDIDPVSLNIDPDQIEAAITPKTKAILPVEVFGNPAGFDRIEQIANRHDLLLIEDSCEGLGSRLNGRKVGTFGMCSTFAFYPNKQMTTGEGGIILTDNLQLADLCASLRNQGRGKGSGWLAHERLGYNYRLSDINCALGIVQLSRIDEFIAARKRAAALYHKALADEDRITLPHEATGVDLSWFVFVLRLCDDFSLDQRNEILTRMGEHGIQASNYFPPVHLQPFIAEQYGCKEGDFPITDRVCRSTIALPFFNRITEEQIGEVSTALRACMDQVQK